MKKENAIIGVLVDKKIIQYLQALALKEGRSLSGLVRQIIKEYIMAKGFSKFENID